MQKLAFALPALLVLSASCTNSGAASSQGGTGGEASGGPIGSGGVVASGGSVPTGGIVSSGGSGSGGNISTGGISGSAPDAGSTGGAMTGGRIGGTGGITGTGGALAGATPGTSGIGNGGTAGTGGASGSGGKATGGSSTGGNLGTGGTGTGGVPGSGGKSTGSTQGTGGGPAGGGTGAGGGGSGGAPGAGGSSSGGSSGTTTGVVGAPIGFATLNGGTKGGLGGQAVTVKTFADLKTYAESTTAYVILVEGTISNGPNGGEIAVKSNKSLVGVGSTAFLNGIGLAIKDVSNIIIQNLRLSLTGVTTRTETAGVYTANGSEGTPTILVNGGDVISISNTAKNIWIDHCELFSEDPSKQTNINLYDGLIDIKAQTGFITISWCYLHDHHKGGLVGAADDDLFADRKVTFHHNYYNQVKLRVPMYRGAVGHFFNNYIVGATDATEIRAGTCVRVEKNYYEALHYSIYTPSDAPGSTERIDNVEVSRTSRAYPANCTADIPYAYADALTGTTNDVKTVVPQNAGVGKL